MKYKLQIPRPMKKLLKKVPGWAKLTGVVLVLFIVFLAVYATRVHALNTSARHAGTTGDETPVAIGSGTAWSNTGNAVSSNNSYASVALASQATSHYLNLSNFGFTTSDVPTGATINGIVAAVERNGTQVASRCHVEDNSIKIMKGNAITGSTEMAAAGTQWPTSDTSATYGSSSSLWGQTWVVSDITSTGFGIVISAKNIKDGGGGNTCTASIDDVTLTVYYTPPPVAYNQISYRVFDNPSPIASSSATFSKAWGVVSGFNTDDGYSVVQTSDRGYAVCGDTALNNTDASLLKYDSAGNLMWSKAWNIASGSEDCYSLIQTADGGFAMTGSTNGVSGTNVFLARFDSSGTLSWSRTWGNGGSEQGRSIIQTSDGGFAIAGYTVVISGGIGTQDAFIAKFTPSGTLSWSRLWGSTSLDEAYSIIQTSDGGYAITGFTQASYVIGGSSSDVFLAKFTSSGTLSWSRLWGGTGDDRGYSIIQTSDGGYAMTGSTTSFGVGGGTSDVFLVKFTSSGSPSWSRTWGGTGSDSGFSVIQNSDGDYVIAGDTNSFGSANYHQVLIKYSSTGAFSWSRRLGAASVSQDHGQAVIQADDGGYVVVGEGSSFSSGSFDIYTSKYDSSGNIANCSTKCTVDGTDYTSTRKADTVGGGGSDYTSTTKFDTVGGGGTDYTSTTKSDTVGGGSDYTSTTKTDGTDYTSSTQSDTVGGGSSYTSTQTVIATASPSVDVGSSRTVSQNTAATVPGDGQPFRLRMDIRITSYQLTAGANLFKLQYAARGTDLSCDTSFTGESYADVTDYSTVRYYDNLLAVNGLPLTANANDPTDGGNSIVPQTYQEKATTTFTSMSTVASGSDGMWDFALTTDHTLAGAHYCLRIVKSSGNLDTYTTIPEIITPSSTYTQSSYRIFNPGTTVNTFGKSWGGSAGIEVPYSVVQTSDGGYAITGETTSFSAGSTDVFVAKYTALGALSWDRHWGGTSNDTGRSITENSSGDLIVTGSSSSTGAVGSNDVILLKFNGTTGALISQLMWGDTGNDIGRSVIQNSAGDYVVLASTRSFGATAGDMVLIKFGSAMTSVLWDTMWGGSSGNDEGTSVIQTSDGGYAVSGYSASFGAGSFDAVLIKFDSSGVVTWDTTWGGTAVDHGSKLIQTSDGGYALTGDTASFGTGVSSSLSNAFLAKYNSSGTLQWSRTWGGSSTSTIVGNSVVQTSDGSYAINGYQNSFGAGGNDAFLAKYNSSGTLQWSRTWGGSGTEASSVSTFGGGTLVKTSDGGYAIVADTTSFVVGGTSPDAALLKYDASGNINGCSSSNCTVPAATSITASAYFQDPSAITSSPSGTLNTSLTITDAAAGGTVTNIVSLATSVAAGSAVLAQDKLYDAYRTGNSSPNTYGEFRLRLDLDVSGSGTDTSAQSFKLQYSLRGSDGVCDTSWTNESYADVTNATPIAYYNDTNSASGDGLHWSTNDPTSGANILSPQTYQEANNFTNSMSRLYSGDSGEWEFALAILSGTQPGNDYCLRVVTSAGSTISYSQIVDIAYGPSMPLLMRQGAWFNRTGTRQGFWIKGQ